MPNFVSKGGVWEPAQEYAVNPNAPKGKEIYKGPDRAALSMLKEAGVEKLGMKYELDPELIQRARQLGFKDVKEYLQMYNFDEEKANVDFLKKRAKINDHKLPTKRKVVATQGGGTDTSGGGASKQGGFGKPEELGGGD